MRQAQLFMLGSTLGISMVQAMTLDDICTTSYIGSALPTNLTGLNFDPTLIETAVQNYTSGSSNYSYCNVTLAYAHEGLNDQVLVNFWLPEPSTFQDRYLSQGGGGEAINSGLQANAAGLAYGAVAGITDGGFGSFSTEFDTDGVDLIANGTLNWHGITMFGYQAHHELVQIGKILSSNTYNSSRIYAYYQGCSEGGREGMSQLQRYDDFDGLVIGAPAFRYAHQQTNHLFPPVVEETLGYVPNPCELEYIVNATIIACDPLDGRTDGVVSRSDLCKLGYNISTVVGQSYACPAQEASMRSPARTAQNGTVQQQAVDVAQTILDGLKTSDGKQAYFSWQPSASFSDASPTVYNETTGEWELPTGVLGITFITRRVQELDLDTLPLQGVTYDTLKDWMDEGMHKFYSSLQTTWPDLSAFEASGGKVIHYHGESDDSIPAASSVHYYDQVAQIMYPGMDFNASHAALADWYRLFLVPGAGYCSRNAAQPNGPFPVTPLTDLIAWVEQGMTPEILNATVVSGDFAGEQGLCAWPLRPSWNKQGEQACEYDQASVDTWQYELEAFKMPIY